MYKLAIVKTLTIVWRHVALSAEELFYCMSANQWRSYARHSDKSDKIEAEIDSLSIDMVTVQLLD